MANIEDAAMLPLVGGLYEAAIQETSWFDAWKAILDAFSATTGSLFLDTPQGIEGIAFAGFSDTALSLYAAHYHKADPWAAIIAQRPRDTTVLCQEFVPSARFEQSEAWQDYSRIHLGAFHCMGGGVVLPDGATTIFGLHRERSMREFSEEERLRLHGLLPHLRNTVVLARRLAAADAARHNALAALDAIATGAFVVDGNATILLANRAAETIARSGPLRIVRVLAHSGIGPGRSRLVASSQPDTARLHGFIQSGARGGPGGGMRLAPDGGAPVLRVLVMPLPAGMGGRGPIGTPPGRALVLATTLDHAVPLPLDLLVSIYELSGSEASVARALLGGATAEQVARARHVSIATIRTQIRSILEKTGARNVRDLERFIAAP